MMDSSAFPGGAMYVLAICIFVFLFVEVGINIGRKLWAGPATMVYGTVAAWYLMEPLYTPEQFLPFNKALLEDVFFQVILFLLAYRLAVSALVNMSVASAVWRVTPDQRQSAGSVLVAAIITWFALLLAAMTYSGKDFFSALFPLEGRSEGAGSMWARPAMGGSGDFLVSAGSSLYLFLSAGFGILLPLVATRTTKVLCVAFIVISWPYFFLAGARSLALGVAVPGMLCWLVMSPARVTWKLVIAVCAFMLISKVFELIIFYRNFGFTAAGMAEAQAVYGDVAGQKHLGLNMASELAYINYFYDSGSLEINLGGRYLSELLNVVPRALWPDKPTLGIDYSMLRGFASGGGGAGVFATISTGVIGQGFVNFGPVFGPWAAGLLMAVWTRILCRLAATGEVVRKGLALMGLGLTFNLGRDITLLVLWPFVFGFAALVCAESLVRPGRPKAQGGNRNHRTTSTL